MKKRGLDSNFIIDSAGTIDYHELCHVLQHECRFKEAVEFMEALAESWPSCSSFM
ncbi:hypothetical protein ARALYDRAFT_893559 [Arabidopsis lyrata subsp. lyrata]|uniref:Uncharacterized protein n=1 Tax=Arabidopsis lyrata subsp. lyrata TaxID=81972 RepID=D7KXE6_ARALL|nr:hypothetical protein ARALYDRAFT_893559 [Arabidopsis lyrata subsp. lyrata]